MTVKLNRRIAALAELKQQIAELDDKRKELEAEVLELMESAEITTTEVEIDGVVTKATAVYSSTVKIDSTGLQGELSGSMWNQITKRVLDERLLEDKVARGLIDIDVVARHSTEVPRKPYVKITGGK